MQEQMSVQLSLDILDRYFRGACSPAEIDQIARWAEGDPARTRYLAVSRAVWEATGVVPARFNTAAAWRTVTGWVEEVESERASKQAEGPVRVLRLYPPSAKPTRVWRWRVPALAAAVLVVATGSVAMWPRLWPGHRGASLTSAGSTREYATGKGQRAEVLLSDGTRVLLSVESHLRVPATYGSHTRELYLDGEAYFDVKHDAQRPFRVYTAGTITEDLGTTFAIRAYPGDTSASVLVTSGQVALRAQGAAVEGITVTDGQFARLGPTGTITVNRAPDIDTQLAWMRGRLQFQLASLATVARELERWYNVDITLADTSLAGAQLTASFTDQPLDDVLNVVARSLDLTYMRTGSRVEFSARRHAR